MWPWLLRSGRWVRAAAQSAHTLGANALTRQYGRTFLITASRVPRIPPVVQRGGLMALVGGQFQVEVWLGPRVGQAHIELE
ncbi:hypothetical protein, partial [Streptomyces sp. XY413]|uniref:hypothetical protein n=1 Tax=Streptomyces sp. XY413 TaxID=1519479 RepID=UPI001F33E461